MKRSEIEKRLKKEAREHTPELYDKIVYSAKSEGLLRDEPECNEIYDQGNTAVVSRNKKGVIVGIVSVILAVIASLVIILSVLLNPANPVVPKKLVLSTNDVYGMGAVSTVRLLGGSASAQALRSFSEVRSEATRFQIMPAAEDGEAEVKAQAKKFNEYFTALDGFMGEEIVTTVSETNTDEKYPYETKLTISGRNFNGEAVRHIMYFTETPAERDDDEEEYEYSLTGVLVADGADYRLEGERSFEQEKDETENQLKIRAYADLTDKTSYVEMEQEHSTEEGETETEYVYSVYSGGVLVEQTAVEFETEKDGDKEEVEYELEFRQGEAKGSYVVERETENGHTRIKVYYIVNGMRGEFRIKRTAANAYIYVFSDGTELTF